MQCHGAALAEAGQHDALGRYAARHLLRDQGHDGALRGLDAGRILLADQIRAQDVVPGRHHITAIDRDWHAGRVWKHKADRRAVREIQLGHQPGKVMAVSAQAMQPDHGGGGVRG